MKNFRKIVSALLAASLAFSALSVSAGARAPASDDDPGIFLLTATPPTEIELPTTLNRFMFTFHISEGFNWYKIAINTRVPGIRFSIRQATGNGDIVFALGTDETVPADGSTQAYYGYLSAGEYNVEVSVLGGGRNLGGTLVYQTGETEAALRPDGVNVSPSDDSGASTLDVLPTTEIELPPTMSAVGFPFVIGEGFNWFEIAVNTRVPGIRFTITKRDTGELVYVPDGTVSANGSTQAYYGYLPAGRYTLTVSVLGGGHNLGGTLWYRTAANEAGLKN